MKRKFNFFILLVLAPLFGSMAQQINSTADIIDEIEELRTLSQKLGSYYILSSLYPTVDKYKNKEIEYVDKFNEALVKLIDADLDEEINIELQKLNLTWLYVNKILKSKFDVQGASKVLDKLEDLQNEAESIAEMILKRTRKDIAKIVKVAAETRVMFQRLNLYFMAKKAKIRNPHIEERYADSVRKIKEGVAYLESWDQNDDTMLMMLEMLKNKMKPVVKTTDVNKVNYKPVIFNMIAEGFDEDLKLLIKAYKEKTQ